MPKVDLELAAKTASKISQAIEKGLIRSCHDCSEGGLAVALAEMAFAGGLGVKADISKVVKSDDCDRADKVLFSESASRYVLEVEQDKLSELEKLFADVPFSCFGEVTQSEKLVVTDEQGSEVVDADIDSLKSAWQKPLAW